MTPNGMPTTDDVAKAIPGIIASHRTYFIVQGVILIILGLLAVAMPFVGTLAVEVLVGWLFFIGGIVRTISLLSERRLPGIWWSLAAAFLAAVLGLILIADPFQGAITLTMVLMVVFFVEGIAAVVSALNFRDHSANWGWLLLTGLVDLFLVFLIWQGWPGTAAWAIGLLAGVNLTVTGLSLTMVALASAAKSGKV